MQSRYEKGSTGREVGLGLADPPWWHRVTKPKCAEGEREGGWGDDFNETYPWWAVFFHWELT